MRTLGQRNRVISGLSQGVVVVEAPESSGALNTVRHALEQGRTVMTVPGNIDRPSSAGTNQLLKEGAAPVTQTDDILRALNMVPVSAAPPRQHALDMPLASTPITGTKPAARAPFSNAASEEVPSGADVSAKSAGPSAASETQRKVLSCLSLTPRHIDAVAQDAGLTATQAGVEITLMELSGMVRRLPGNNYIRSI